MFYLCTTETDKGDFNCPHCDTGLHVTEWTTEYGNPLEGDHSTHCPKCGKMFEMNVEVCVHYTAFPR
jgi:transcription elongation factor Elf1